MKAIQSIHAVDSHTMGEPTRVIIGGIPKIPGNTMAEKKTYLETKMDRIRTAVMLEPRGHNDMFGSIITAPIDQDADFGIIFMDSGGYLNMCGHGSIGAMTIAVETGMVEPVEPITKILMETPAGLIKGEVAVESGRAREVSIVNVPSFLYEQDFVIQVPEIGQVNIDIAFGGSFFAIVSARQLNLSVDPENSQRLKEVGLVIRDIVNSRIKVSHPKMPHINTVDLVEIYDEPTHPQAHFKNVVIFGKGNIDRSSCGTGTSAKMATLHARGKLGIGQEFVYESILGTLFKGKILEETQVCDYKAIIPQITASAYITGFNHFVIDEDDPFKYGFLLK
jgi:proline racemase